MSTLLTLAVIGGLAFLGWHVSRRVGSNRLGALNDRRRATSTLVSRGDYIDGNRRLPVALALSESTFFYENSAMEGSLDLAWVREVEYDTELATGIAIENGKVLRLRSDSQTFEFVLPKEVAVRWSDTLPARTVAPSAITQAAAVTR